jgi:glycosyltransferase involved in cell wall biosynthesis
VSIHVAVDGSFWGGQERGVAAATRRLWRAFLDERASAGVTVFAPASVASAWPVSHVAVGPLAGASRFTWQQFALPALLRTHAIDLLHCPCYTAPLTASCRTVVTVHDLIAWTHPRLAGWRNALHLRTLVGAGIRRADAVCVPTDVVRRAVVDRFGVPPQRVFVVPWGVDADIAPWPREAAARDVYRRFGVSEPFVLLCGCVEAKKNVVAAIRAAADAGVLLLVAGPWVSSSAAVVAGAARGGRWRYLGFVSPSALSALYSAAVALLMPSHVEGFGLPTIEAMRCGCPVIASDTPALAEVCGGAALHVPASDPTALAKAIRSVATDAARRDDLVARGLARAARFSWSASVGEFAAALDYAGRA